MRVRVRTFVFVFQFTPLREGRPLLKSLIRVWSISIHAPPRGATEKQEGLKAFTTFQFTPLREGRRYVAQRCP